MRANYDYAFSTTRTRAPATAKEISHLRYVYDCDDKMTTDNRSESKRDTTYGIAIGLAIGAGAGAGLGVLMGNIAFGIALGAGIGVALGASIPSARRGKNTGA